MEHLKVTTFLFSSIKSPPVAGFRPLRSFFDFTINFGGAPQGSVYLAQRLNAIHDVHVIDAYGCCKEYNEAVQKAGLSYQVLCPEISQVYIGHENNLMKRLGRIFMQSPSLLQLRSRLIRTVREIDPDVIWINNEKSLVFLASSLKLKKYPMQLYLKVAQKLKSKSCARSNICKRCVPIRIIIH